MVNVACAEKIFAGKDCNILLLLIIACVSMEQISMPLLNKNLLIVINDVPVIILSVKCCDCAKVKQANTFSTCILSCFHKSGNVHF